MFSRAKFSDFVVGQKDCATTAFRCRFADAETATVGVGRSTVLGDYQIAPFAARGAAKGRWRLAPPGKTDSHASDIGHWLGMTEGQIATGAKRPRNDSAGRWRGGGPCVACHCEGRSDVAIRSLILGGRIPTPVCTPRVLASRRALARNDRAGRRRGGEGAAKECEKKRQAEPVSFLYPTAAWGSPSQ